MKLMDEYKSKCVSAEEAVKVIQSGDWVEFAWAASFPGLLTEAIAKRKDELVDVNMRGGIIIEAPAVY
jgi:acyl-CoA hydrolase